MLSQAWDHFARSQSKWARSSPARSRHAPIRVARVRQQSAAAMSDAGDSEGSAANANADLIRRGYAAFARGDIAAVLAILAEDVLWHVPGRGPLARDYRGHGEVLGFFGRFMELCDRTFRVQIDDVLANSERVVVLCTESAQRVGRS